MGSASDPQGPSSPDWGAGGPPPVPSCYRHPDRETYIRCTRCERPICPDCMHEASVGFQCPECVRAGNVAVRQARTVFGGTVHADSGLVSKTLIGITVLAYLAQQVVPDLETRFMLLSSATINGQPAGVASGEVYRLLTAAFLHGGLLHLFFNMYLLYALGPTLERAFGRLRFAVLYFGSALLGAALSYTFLPPGSAALGASGAIFGLFGATLLVTKRLQYDVRPIAVLIGINLVLQFILPRIDWRAHLGGLAAGLVLGAAFAYAPPRLRTPVAVVAGLLVAAAVVVLVAARTAALTG